MDATFTMSCSKCPGKVVYENKNTGNLCSSCFLDMIEKRLRKEIKNSGWLEKNEKVLILDDDSLEANVTEDLFKKVMGSLPLQVEITPNFNNDKEIVKFGEHTEGQVQNKSSVLQHEKKEFSSEYNHIILPWSLEREVNGFLSDLFNSKESEKNKSKCIKLLKSISEEEIILIAKIKNIPGKLKGTEKDFIADLEKKYPGGKMALVKAMKEFG